MKINNRKKWITITSIFIMVVIFGCGNKEEKNKNDVNLTNPASSDSTSAIKKEAAEDISVSVDGKYLTKLQLEKEFKEFMNVNKDQLPQGKTKEIKTELIEKFIVRTVLENEIEKRKISVTDNEINEAIEQLKSNLPVGQKINDFFKQNRLTMEKLREDIAFAVKLKQLVKIDLGKKAKPSEKEINKFYDENKDKLVVPESVHVRHILVAIEDSDDDKIKAEKKTKIENLHKQLTDGADFAELASKYSDCPSKENGGDLGIIKKGETVKQFEDAAFSQEKEVIGPVVSTEYGHHIIQVLEHNNAKTITLAETKKEISNYLEQQKQMEAFGALVKKLRENAKIVIYEY